MDISFENLACNSPAAFGIKRRPEEDESPMAVASSCYNKRATKKKLSFDFQASPIFASAAVADKKSPSVIDEDSCDSGFSESHGDLVADCCNESFEILKTFSQKLAMQDAAAAAASPLCPLEKSKSSADLAKAGSRRMSCRAKSTSNLDMDNFNDAAIMEALERLDEQRNNQLVGDMSTHHVLPVLQKSKHKDLASITPDTLSDLLNGKYDDQVERFLIFDARFPYEYDGGHIATAENVYRKEDSFERLFAEPIQPQHGKRVILVFHCEFSSERGPRLMREVRERDRMLNAHNYPNLFYPEMYLLEGGYKNFYETCQAEHCEPRSYMPMLHDNHRNDLKFFRKKSKTWGPDATRKSSLTSTATTATTTTTTSSRTPLSRTKSRLTFN